MPLVVPAVFYPILHFFICISFFNLLHLTHSDSISNIIGSCRQIGPQRVGPRTVGPRKLGPGQARPVQFGPGHVVPVAQMSAPKKWTVGLLKSGKLGPGPNCQPPKSGQFGLRQLSGAQLSGAQPSGAQPSGAHRSGAHIHTLLMHMKYCAVLIKLV